ncbi:sensor histidine kinase [Myceligenerans halotolerans]
MHEPPPPAPQPRAFSWLPDALAPVVPTKWHLVRSLLLVFVCFFSSGVAVSSFDMAGRPPGLQVEDVTAQLITIPAFLLAFLVPWLVFLRDVAPATLCLTTSALPVLLPYDALTPLVVLPAVYAFRSARWIVVCTAAVAVAIAAVSIREVSMLPEYRILVSSDPATGEVAALPEAGYVVLGLMYLAVAVGVGFWRRAVAARRQVTTLTERHATHTAVLEDRITRQHEREDIAREVHDTIGHSLSQIALQASALEADPNATPEAREAAVRIRAAARQAGTELRGVLDVLRTGAEGITAVSFDDLGALLVEAQQQGAMITSTVFVSEGRTAATGLTRACYRIVQESLTNALKHAPGMPVMISLSAAPGTGVVITARNPLPQPAAGQVDSEHATPDAEAPARRALTVAEGSGHGIAGMTERATALGGTLTAGGMDGAWTVTARMPWRAVDS